MFRYPFIILSAFISLNISAAEKKLFDENTPTPDVIIVDRVTQQLRLLDFKNQRMRKLKIAVLDNSFGGYKAALGKGLPADTTYDRGTPSLADQVEFTSVHGTVMAKSLAAAIKKSGVQADYELHLFKTFGPTKFEYAVNRVVQDRFDLVLYASTWEDGGNVDGTGFIDKFVKRATDAGVIWINAAGEHGGEMRVDPIQLENRNGERWMVFKDKKGQTRNGITINCVTPICKLDLTAIWSDIKDDFNVGTDKDLDMFLYDPTGQETAKSQDRQKLTQGDDGSIIPREMIKKVIPKGKYVAKFKAFSNDFTSGTNVLRVLATGPGIQLEDATFDETIFPPADNPAVIVIGASDDPTTSRSTKLGRPDVYFPSQVELKSAKRMSGAYSTSIASSLAAAFAALKLGTGTTATRYAVLAELKKVGSKKAPKTPVTVAANSPAQAQAKPTAPPAQPAAPASASTLRCYQEAELPYYYRAVNRLIESGGKPIIYHGRLLIAVTSEFAKRNDLNRAGVGTNMWYFITPEGIQAFSGDDIRAGLPQEYYLIGYTDIPLCQ
jgi:hypothetical protein